MTKINLSDYETVRENAGFIEMPRGLIEVSGGEAIRFLNGLITNDVAALVDGAQMSAAFPNAQGRLLAVVRVRRRGDKFLFETEATTREKIFQNLFRFTYAGDFLVRDLSDDYAYFAVQKSKSKVQSSHSITFENDFGADYFVPKDAAGKFKIELETGGAIEMSGALAEILRVENGKPLYGVDMDEMTIVPEIGLPDVISYNKGCYIGQEIIARIHFRGHVAKRLTGLVFDETAAVVNPNDEIKSADGKNAGRVTSVVYSPALEKVIALAYVRYDYLTPGTPLKIDDFAATVKDLPFVERLS